MITVSDTTPLRYLVEIEAIEVFSQHFGQVIVPLLVSFNRVFELLPV